MARYRVGGDGRVGGRRRLRLDVDNIQVLRWGILHPKLLSMENHGNLLGDCNRKVVLQIVLCRVHTR